MKLLLCEDEKELSNALRAILRHNNYTVDAVYDGEDALAYAEADSYDGIILDIMMPKMSGLEVLSTLRKHGNNTPVLILTAKSETENKIEGLDLGADDYLAKPFDMGELLARVRAVTRRGTSGLASDTISYGDLTLNKQSFELSTPKQSIRLGGKEYGIIELLISNPASLISTEKIMERVWGYDSEAEINVVWVYISSLRKKLAQIGSSVEIKASRGLGYTLEKANRRRTGND